MKVKRIFINLFFFLILFWAGSCSGLTKMQKLERDAFDPPRNGGMLKEQRRFEQNNQLKTCSAQKGIFHFRKKKAGRRRR